MDRLKIGTSALSDWDQMNDRFPSIRFRGELRPSQTDVVQIARQQLEEGNKKLHVVAPPGSGKTVMGLFLWAECIRVPAVVLSPNSAIQAQWADRLDLFNLPAGSSGIVSTNPAAPGWLTSLTYQSVTLPHRGGRDDDAEAVNLWMETLIESQQAQVPDEAQVWINDLKRHNRSYYNDRLSSYRKVIRDRLAQGGKALKTLHASALETLERLKQAGVGLLILDECHHLLSHWGRVLADAHRYFNHPIVVGLTATPPDPRGKPREDVERYKKFFGPVDYEVPVPAVVKDGFLAPYQDLVQFVRPTPDELAYVANADDQLYELMEELCQPDRAVTGGKVDNVAAPGFAQNEVEQAQMRETLPAWLSRVLSERRLPIGTMVDWPTYADRDPALAWAGPRFLEARGVPLPDGVPQPAADERPLSRTKQRLVPETDRLPMKVLIPVLDRYIRHRLRRSADPADHRLAEAAIGRLRMLGTQITETGSRACASPIGRLMAYARGKAEAIVPILRAEREALGERIRAIVVTDFEKSSAVTAEISHLLDEEAGGAVAAFRVLLSHPETDWLDPILVTGSTVLVDDDLAERFDAAASAWLTQEGLNVELDFGEEDGFHVVSGRGGDWWRKVRDPPIRRLPRRHLAVTHPAGDRRPLLPAGAPPTGDAACRPDSPGQEQTAGSRLWTALECPCQRRPAGLCPFGRRQTADPTRRQRRTHAHRPDASQGSVRLIRRIRSARCQHARESRSLLINDSCEVVPLLVRPTAHVHSPSALLRPGKQ